MIKHPTNTIQRCIDCNGSTSLPTGQNGQDGQYGGYSSLWKYSSNTTPGDPGSNYLRFDATNTNIYISRINADTASMVGFLASLDDSGSAGNYGFIRIFKEYDSNTHIYFKVTSVTNSGTYYTLGVTLIDSNNSFTNNDAVVFTFTPAGAVGTTGTAGTNGTNGIDGKGYDATSSTSLTLATGSQTLTINTNKAYMPSASRVRIAYILAANTYMEGVVTAYTPATGVMTVLIDRFIGSGTYNSWNISIIGDIATYDTGWLDLQGFSFYSGTKPKYRIVNKTIQFRGTVVIPLTDGLGGNLAYSGVSSYADNTVKAPGALCTINGNYSLYMNNGNSVFQSSAHHPDSTYTGNYQIALRTILSQTANKYLPLTSMLFVSVDTSGRLTISTIYDQEDSFAGNGVDGTTPMRFLTSNVSADDWALDFRTVGTIAPYDTLHSHDTNSPLTYSIAVSPYKHALSIDAADANQIGGFAFNLDQLTAMIA
jgi:hypothetical protein